MLGILELPPIQPAGKFAGSSGSKRVGVAAAVMQRRFAGMTFAAGPIAYVFMIIGITPGDPVRFNRALEPVRRSPEPPEYPARPLTKMMASRMASSTRSAPLRGPGCRVVSGSAKAAYLHQTDHRTDRGLANRLTDTHEPWQLRGEASFQLHDSSGEFRPVSISPALPRSPPD